MIRVFTSFCFLFAATTPGWVVAERPDIILIMADDVGIEGLGCYGGTSYKTPHLDRLAAEGVRFSNAFSQPLCTPTRVELMTGKDNHRNWTYFGILDPNERTFGDAMTDAGYRTGIFGKWQLQSYDPPDLPGADQRRGTGMHPKDAGFDTYSLFHALHTEDKGSRYSNPTMLEGVRGDDGTLKTYEGRYGEDVWVEQILQFLDQPTDKPRFVYYPMALPHWPFQPTPDSDEWNPGEPPVTDLRFARDMIEYMDTTVGDLMDGLEQRGLDEETVVIFYSDNGTHLDVRSRMADGRTIPGGKAMTTQTGVHVPLIVHCPKRFPPAVVDGIVEASDFYPTLLELAESTKRADKHLDGFSIVPMLSGTKDHVRDHAFFWYDPRPGWDKEHFSRHVFALNRTHKLFRDGKLYRLGPLPLQETLVETPSASDLEARTALRAVIDQALQGVEEPPLVDSHGKLISETVNEDLSATGDDAVSAVEQAAKQFRELVCSKAIDFKDPNQKQAIDLVRRHQFEDARFNGPIVELFEDGLDDEDPDFAKLDLALALLPHSTLDREQMIGLFFRCGLRFKGMKDAGNVSRQLGRILAEFPDATSRLLKEQMEKDGVTLELIPLVTIVGEASADILPMLVKACRSEDPELAFASMNHLDRLIDALRKRSAVQSRVADAIAQDADPKFVSYAERIVSRYDRNRDGVLSQAEWSKMLLTPEDADRDGDGRITAIEYAIWMQSRSTRP